MDRVPKAETTTESKPGPSGMAALPPAEKNDNERRVNVDTPDEDVPTPCRSIAPCPSVKVTLANLREVRRCVVCCAITLQWTEIPENEAEKTLYLNLLMLSVRDRRKVEMLIRRNKDLSLPSFFCTGHLAPPSHPGEAAEEAEGSSPEIPVNGGARLPITTGLVVQTSQANRQDSLGDLNWLVAAPSTSSVAAKGGAKPVLRKQQGREEDTSPRPCQPKESGTAESIGERRRESALDELLRAAVANRTRPSSSSNTTSTDSEPLSRLNSTTTLEESVAPKTRVNLPSLTDALAALAALKEKQGGSLSRSASSSLLTPATPIDKESLLAPMEQPVNCPICEKMCNSFFDLGDHLPVHSIRLCFFKCNGCQHGFRTPQGLQAHIEQQCNDGNARCMVGGAVVSLTESKVLTGQVTRAIRMGRRYEEDDITDAEKRLNKDDGRRCSDRRRKAAEEQAHLAQWKSEGRIEKAPSADLWQATFRTALMKRSRSERITSIKEESTPSITVEVRERALDLSSIIGARSPSSSSPPLSALLRPSADAHTIEWSLDDDDEASSSSPANTAVPLERALSLDSVLPSTSGGNASRPTQYEVVEHLFTRVNCPYCQQPCVSFMDVHRHVSSMHPDEKDKVTYWCDRGCQKDYKTPERLRSHLTQQSQRGIDTCIGSGRVMLTSALEAIRMAGGEGTKARSEKRRHGSSTETPARKRPSIATMKSALIAQALGVPIPTDSDRVREMNLLDFRLSTLDIPLFAMPADNEHEVTVKQEEP